MANFFRSVLLRLQNKTVTAGTSASSVTKDSGYDGLGTVTINPTPSETKTQAAGTSNIDVTPTSGKLLSKVTVTPTPTETKSATPSTTAQTITPSSGKYLSSVSVGAISTQTKSATPSTSAQTITPDSGKYLTSVSISAISTETKSQAAGTSNIDVTPTSGKYLTKVTITPQQHSGSFTPTANLKGASGNANDMGASHNNRYVDTSGMIVPSGNKSISANGTGIDVASYSTVSVSVPHPTHTTTYTPTANKSDNDMGTTHSYRYVNTSGMITPSGNKAITANGTGIDVKSYSTVSVDVPHPTHTTTYTPAANKSNNDMGATHSYRYVNTSGMIVPSGNKSITANGTGIDVSSYSTVSVSVPNPTLSGDAAAGNVLSGKTFYSNSYTKQTGTMVINEIDPREEVIYNLGSNEIIKNASSYSGVVLSGINYIVPSNSNSPRVNPNEGYWIQDQEGYVVNSISVPSPSNSSPATMTYPNIYQLPTNTTGYLISSYQSKTPDTSGVAFNSGMVKMSSGGYAYSEKPTPQLKRTTLWMNSAPTSNLGAGDVTLTDSIDNYKYLEFVFRASTSNSKSSSVIVDKDQFKTYLIQGQYPQLLLGWTTKNTSSSHEAARRVYYVSNTTIHFTNNATIGSSGNNNAYSIPTYIYGLKLSI